MGVVWDERTKNGSAPLAWRHTGSSDTVFKVEEELMNNLLIRKLLFFKTLSMKMTEKIQNLHSLLWGIVNWLSI